MIARYMHSEGRNIVVAVRDVKRQTNSYDCGVFALAFAYSLAAGQDPSQLTYINPRAHVEECLVSGTVSPFPSRVTHRSRDVIHSLNEEVYCFCRGIDNNTQMVMCDSCEQWFHKACVSVTKTELQGKWQCKECVKSA